MNTEVRTLLSQRVAKLYDRSCVNIAQVDRAKLEELGFEKKHFKGMDGWEVWTNKVPDTYNFPEYVAVSIREGRSRIYEGEIVAAYLSGIQDHCLSSQGWKGRDFGDFLDFIYFRNPDGSPGNEDAVAYVDGLVGKLLDARAFVSEEVERWPSTLCASSARTARPPSSGASAARTTGISGWTSTTGPARYTTR